MFSRSIGIVRAAALISVLFTHACDTTEPGPDSVNVSPRTARLILAGDTVRLSAEVRDKSGNSMPDVVVNWLSSDAQVATVTAAGLVTMSDCVPLDWISDYHFTNALRFRLSPADSSGLPDRGPRTESLLLWGGFDTRGKPFLEPAFAVEAPPALPGSVGEYRLAGHSSAGNELFALSFDMPEVADGGGATGFAFVLPAEPGWAGNLARITLSGPGGSVRLDQDTDLGLAIVRDPRSGQVRAILRDGAESAEAQAEEVVKPT